MRPPRATPTSVDTHDETKTTDADYRRVREHILSFDMRRLSPHTTAALEALDRIAGKGV